MPKPPKHVGTYYLPEEITAKLQRVMQKVEALGVTREDLAAALPHANARQSYEQQTKDRLVALPSSDAGSDLLAESFKFHDRLHRFFNDSSECTPKTFDCRSQQHALRKHMKWLRCFDDGFFHATYLEPRVTSSLRAFKQAVMHPWQLTCEGIMEHLGGAKKKVKGAQQRFLSDFELAFLYLHHLNPTRVSTLAVKNQAEAYKALRAARRREARRATALTRK